MSTLLFLDRTSSFLFFLSFSLKVELFVSFFVFECFLLLSYWVELFMHGSAAGMQIFSVGRPGEVPASGGPYEVPRHAVSEGKVRNTTAHYRAQQEKEMKSRKWGEG